MSAHPTDGHTIPRSGMRQLAVAAGVVLGLVLLSLLVVFLVRSLGSSDPLAAHIKSTEYQAVFLSNGQVYFGKLEAPGGDFYYLSRVYYLQQQVSPQSGRRPRQALIKLGNEIHGPEDLMVISKRQILFVENLKPGGQVSRAISRSAGGP